MPVRQQLGQGFVDSSVGAGDRLGAGALDGIERGQNDGLSPQMFDQGIGQHDAVRRELAGQPTPASQCMSQLWDTDSRGKVISTVSI